MKKIHIPFMTILTEINALNITSKTALIENPKLYEKYWVAAESFSLFCLSSKTTTNKNGEVNSGNAYRVEALVNNGVTTKEDIKLDSMIKLVEDLERLIYDKSGTRRTVPHQYNTAYKFVNDTVVNQYRKLPPKDIKIVPFNGTIDSDVVDKDNAYTYEDIIGDNTYNAERIYLEQETIAELSKELKAKRMRERAEKREQILHEIATLSKRPAEVLVRLACTHLEMKPRELSELIIDKGCESAYAAVLFKIAKKNGIALENIRNIIAGNMVTAESVWADTNNSKKVAEQISRLKGRADKRLQK